MKTFKQFLKESQTAPLYMCRPLLNAKDVIEWAKSVGFESTLEPDDMHCTIVYSKKPVDWDCCGKSTKNIDVKDGKRSVHEFDGGATVLKFSSKEFSDRQKEFMDAGASFDYPEYQPHVTISYSASDMKNIPPYPGVLKFGPEHFEKINTDKEFKES